MINVEKIIEKLREVNAKVLVSSLLQLLNLVLTLVLVVLVVELMAMLAFNPLGGSIEYLLIANIAVLVLIWFTCFFKEKREANGEEQYGKRC